LPTFYDSMRPDEINVLKTLSASARKGSRGIWQFFSQKIPAFDFAKRYENPKTTTFKPAQDKGKFILPKLYRRQTTFSAQKAAGIFAGSLEMFVATQHKSFLPLAEFLLHGKSGAHEFLENHLHNGVFDLEPDVMVFAEDPSVLVDAPTKTAASITKWF